MRPPPAGHARTHLTVDLVRAGRDWAPPVAQIRTWASAALGRRAAGAELAVRVVRAAESRRLNARYRGRNRPTNVLSFPAPPKGAAGSAGLLGDLVICPAVLRAEARRMERREVAVLKRFGITNPYRSLGV